MLKSLSQIGMDETGDVRVNVRDLYQIRESLGDALKLVNKYISQFSAESMSHDKKYETKEEQTKTRNTIDLFTSKTNTKTRDETKKVSLGMCMFVQKKNLVNVSSREELETSKDRCNKKAFNVKNGVILCSRHKDSDTKRIEDILSGKIPEHTGESTTMEEDMNSLLPEGDYKKKVADTTTSSNEIDDILNEMGRLEKLIEENRFIPCRIGLKETCLVTHSGIVYLVDPCGDCLGKIVDKETVEEFELKAKMKEYFDVEGHISPLQNSDRGFLEHYELIYVKHKPKDS